MTSEQETEREKQSRHQLIVQPEPKRVNLAAFHARKGLKSEISRCDARLQTDLASVLQGHCIYLPGFFAQPTDFSLMQALTADLAKNTESGMVNWSQHLKHDNPDFSNCFKSLLDRMANFFDVEVYATRLNFYPDASAWKPYHHDSHAYGGKQLREDFTMGASFGFERKLSFLHPDSGETFEFPQINGDIFAFTTDANKRFQHGVPKCKTGKSGPRFSIIAWGRRRTINDRNAASDELNSLSAKLPLKSSSNVMSVTDASNVSSCSSSARSLGPSNVVSLKTGGLSGGSKAVEQLAQSVSSINLNKANNIETGNMSGFRPSEGKQTAGGCGCGEEGGAVVMHAREVSRLVDQFVAPATVAKANPWAGGKSRVQGGWAKGGSRVR